MKKALDTINEAEWFCPLPFNHIYSNSSGTWLTCCLGNRTEYTTENSSVFDWYNSKDMINLRLEMLGQKKGNEYISKMCSKCVKQEKTEGTSTREKWVSKLDGSIRILDAKGIGTLYAIQEFLDTHNITFENNNERFIELKLRIFGNLCNLSCYMCWPHNSTTRIADITKMNNPIWSAKFDMRGISSNSRKGVSTLAKNKNDSFLETLSQIKQISKNIDSIKITGGEPLMLDSHYDLLDILIASNDAKYIRLKYQTNLTKFDKRPRSFVDYMHEFKSVDLSVSIDSYNEYDEYIRKNTDTNLVYENLKKIKLKNSIRVSIACTVSILSVLRLEEFFNKFPDYKIEPFVLTTPVFLSIQHLPDDLKSIVRLSINRYKNKISGISERSQSIVSGINKIENTLNLERNETQFQTALQYCLDLDRLYNRKPGLFDLWPELKEYYV